MFKGVTLSENPPIVSIRVFGDLACFTRPEFSVERASYPFPTPSAARGILEAIYWKPRIIWEIRQIKVLKPIRFISFKRNEIADKIPASGLDHTSQRLCDQNRQQRQSTVLRDVDYVIQAALRLNPAIPSRDANDNHGKYLAVFEDRLAKGKTFRQPCFGIREYAAFAEPCSGIETPITEDLHHGMMFFDFHWPKRGKVKAKKQPKPTPLFFSAHMQQGVIEIPTLPEVLAENRVVTP